ncbi:MAG: hypothetical protein J2P54_07780 [Bradyrhizobiaceae bacterium]|nr:hypothetical protein [Bradyrhizobiaceae bacterium]
MWRFIATMVLGSQVTLAAAAGVPNLNAEPSCRAAADSAAMGTIAGGNVRDLASCMRDENEARDQLAKEWSQFLPSEQERCTSETKTGGSPSYVELLVCLEMIRDAKNPSGTPAPTPTPAMTGRRSK